MSDAELFRRAEEQLEPGETVLASIVGYEMFFAPHRAVLVATDRRVLLCREGGFVGYKLRNIPYPSITRFKKKGIMSSELSIWITKGSIASSSRLKINVPAGDDKIRFSDDKIRFIVQWGDPDLLVQEVNRRRNL